MRSSTYDKDIFYNAGVLYTHKDPKSRTAQKFTYAWEDRRKKQHGREHVWVFTGDIGKLIERWNTVDPKNLHFVVAGLSRNPRRRRNPCGAARRNPSMDPRVRKMLDKAHPEIANGDVVPDPTYVKWITEILTEPWSEAKRVAWTKTLQEHDRNGDHLDEMAENQGLGPHTKKSILEILVQWAYDGGTVVKNTKKHDARLNPPRAFWYLVAGRHWVTTLPRPGETPSEALARSYLRGDCTTQLTVTKPQGVTPSEWQNMIRHHAEYKPQHG